MADFTESGVVGVALGHERSVKMQSPSSLDTTLAALGPTTNAGAAADAFDLVMLTVVLGTVGIVLLVNAAVAWGRLRRRR